MDSLGSWSVSHLNRLGIAVSAEHVFWIAGALLLVTAIFATFAMTLRRKADAKPAPHSSSELDMIYRQYATSETQKRRALNVQSLASERLSPPPVRARLEPMEPGASPIELGAPALRIGRHSSNDLRLEGETVHRYHAVLHALDSGRFELEDLKGANGTFVNGERVQKRRLKDGDVLEIGGNKLQFKIFA